MYLVIAYRWGDNIILKEYDSFESNTTIKHSYPVGVYEDYDSAIEEAKAEKSQRGGKYECVIFQCNLNGRISPRDGVYSTFVEYKEYI